ncbi:hypothetical protein [Paenibacillus sp. IITD108]|uniref:hypothetical protein n=1 Tax=Paenibacillus sp. IITD108 TaxID=3116649 RepID=UPI002F4164BD
MKKKNRILSFILIICMVVSIFTNTSITQKDNAFAEGNEEVFTLSIESIVNRYETTDLFVQQQLDAGYSLNQIYTVFFLAERENSNFEQALAALYPSEVNLSAEVQGTVVNELGDPMLRDVTVVEATYFELEELIGTFTKNVTVEEATSLSKEPDITTIDSDVPVEESPTLEDEELLLAANFSAEPPI